MLTGPIRDETTPPARLALVALDALPVLESAVVALAQRALEPNPFMVPAFLAPAASVLGGGQVELACVWSEGRLVAFAPVMRARWPNRFSVWTHEFAPLGAPLVDRTAPEAAVSALCEGLFGAGASLLFFNELPLDGPVAMLVRAAAARHGWRSIEAGVQQRAVLTAPEPGRPASVDQLASAKHRKELRRQLRRFAERHQIVFETARGDAEVAAALDRFVILEASGWKGRRGTALAQDPAELEFARRAILGLARTGDAEIDLMRAEGRVVAALVRLRAGRLSVPWKIAYDERSAHVSPGKQLMWRATEDWLADASIARVDPVCEEGNPLVSQLWRERERYGTLIVAGGAIDHAAASIVARSIDARQHLKQRLRRLRA
ncbi:GNAT family N-acetyltransferase [Propylenella binzhouense]|uniref:GNAT family N-acetyltransferase n=1 Tax=Propylenella binzhouense TaxID=2555902 RepID=UPI0013686005|nr:GNAT family N-acetyltransferase [Propylenella binzhouense]